MTTLDDLIIAERPIASVYLRAPSTTTDAEYRFGTRWKNARRRLEDVGATDDALEQLDRAVTEVGHAAAPALAMFTDGVSAPLVELLDDELEDDLVGYDRAARLIPLMHARQRSLPHLMVVTDRTGADIIAIVGGDEVDSETVEGTDHHIRRGRFGGWSHRRIQQRAENRWEDNAREVADRVGALSNDIGARVVAVAGDVRACQFLMEHLDERTRAIATLVDAGEPDAVADETVRLVADQVARDTKATLEDHANRVNTGTAVAGPDAVLAALSDGRVATLLVVDDADDHRRAHFAADGSPRCSTTANIDGAGEVVEGRLPDVAVRAALLTDAVVRVVPATVFDGNIGAILRW